MTRNQIEYQKLQESKRANRQLELLTQSRDLATLNARLQELGETTRHNQQVESQAWENLGIQRGQLEQSAKQAEAALQNALSNAKNAVTNRINVGINALNAAVNSRNATSNARQAAAAERNAQSNVMQAEASMRHSEAALQSAGAAWKQAQNSAALVPIQAQNAQASIMQAQASAANSYVNYQKMETERRSVDEAVRHNLATESVAKRDISMKEAQSPSIIDLNEARSSQTKTETRYIPQQNARGWIATIASAAKDLTGSVRNVSSSIIDLMKSGRSTK